MFSPELKNLLFQVITSWQVIAVTVLIILYFFLVSYVAKLYHAPRSPSSFSAKKKLKEAAPEPAVAEEGEDLEDETLGLDEE
jgi:hypothetical protein